MSNLLGRLGLLKMASAVVVGIGALLVVALPVMADFDIYPSGLSLSTWTTSWQNTSLTDVSGDYTKKDTLDLYGTSTNSVLSYDFSAPNYFYFQIQVAANVGNNISSVLGDTYFIYMKKVGDTNPITAGIALDLKGAGPDWLTAHGVEGIFYKSGSLPAPTTEDIDLTQSTKLASDINLTGEGFARAISGSTSKIQMAVSKSYFLRTPTFMPLLGADVQLGVATSSQANDSVKANGDTISSLSTPIQLGTLQAASLGHLDEYIATVGTDSTTSNWTSNYITSGIATKEQVGSNTAITKTENFNQILPATNAVYVAVTFTEGGYATIIPRLISDADSVLDLAFKNGISPEVILNYGLGDFLWSKNDPLKTVFVQIPIANLTAFPGGSPFATGVDYKYTLTLNGVNTGDITDIRGGQGTLVPEIPAGIALPLLAMLGSAMILLKKKFFGSSK